MGSNASISIAINIPTVTIDVLKETKNINIRTKSPKNREAAAFPTRIPIENQVENSDAFWFSVRKWWRP